MSSNEWCVRQSGDAKVGLREALENVDGDFVLDNLSYCTRATLIANFFKELGTLNRHKP